MKKTLSLLCAAALAVEMVALSATPSAAAPVRPAPIVSPDNGAPVVDVQWRRRGPVVRRGGGGAAAAIIGGLAAGAIIGGALASRPPVYAGPGNPHTRWCLDRYRSYDPRTDTYQPYSGPRRYCISPYS